MAGRSQHLLAARSQRPGLLTHYPQANDAFSWLDGAAILIYIGASSLVIGGALWLLLCGAADEPWR